MIIIIIISSSSSGSSIQLKNAGRQSRLLMMSFDFTIVFTDYSCALQRDILVHGRLYISQNWLCFYANIFGWETFVSMRYHHFLASGFS